MRLYLLNRRELGPGRAAQVRLTDSDQPLFLGKCATPSLVPGILDEAVVYGRALPPVAVEGNPRAVEN